MDSQEGIELSRLRVHRFSDHYIARAGATSRPVSQISMTDQASDSAGPGLVRPSPPNFAGSDYITQDASGMPSPSNDKLPLVADREEGMRTSTRRQDAAIPWTLRRTSLLGLIAFLAALIATLEVLHYLSNNNQGLATAKEDETYLWKYLPTAGKRN
jgi:hypothetical protein